MFIMLKKSFYLRVEYLFLPIKDKSPVDSKEQIPGERWLQLFSMQVEFE